MRFRKFFVPLCQSALNADNPVASGNQSVQANFDMIKARHVDRSPYPVPVMESEWSQ